MEQINFKELGCHPTCYHALEKKCVCGCGGIHHGVGAGLRKLDEWFPKLKW